MASIVKNRKKTPMVFLPGPRGNPPVNTVAPVLSGVASLGSVLSVTQGTWLNSPNTYNYQWQRSGSDIPGAVLANYTVQNSDQGTDIRCLVTAFNVDGSGSAYSNLLSIPSAGGGGGGGTSDLLMGFNVTDGAYASQNNIESDLYVGAFNIVSRPSGAELTSRGADKAPSALNGGDSSVGYIFRHPEVNGNVLVQFTPGVCSAVAVANGCTIVSGPNLAAGTVTVLPDAGQPSGQGFALNFTPSGATLPVIISAKKVGDSTTFQPSFDTHVSAISNTGGPIRTMKRSGVEGNQGISITSTAGAFPAPVLTAANRNTGNSHDWFGNSGLPNDGPPMEADIAMAVHAGRPLWRCLPWNASNDYYDAVADLAAAAAINNGLTTYFEVANEVWLGSYLVSTQAYYEAISAALPFFTNTTPTVITGSMSGTVLTVTAVTSGPALTVGSFVVGDGIDGNTQISSFGTGTGGTGTYNISINNGTISSRRMVANCGGRLERYCQKVCEVMDRVKARYVAAGAPLGKLRRCFMWGMDDGTSSSLFMEYTPPGFTAVKNHIDVIGGSCYINNTIQGTSVDALYTNVFDNIAWTVDTQAAAWQATATAKGLSCAWYEGGQGTFINDDPTRAAFHADSRMYDFNMHLFARLAAKAPSSAFVNFALPHPQFSNQDFGILHYTGQAADGTTHKYNAARDFCAGQHKLIGLVGSLSCTAGDPSGTVLGTLKYRTPGSTITIPTNPGGGVTITDTTAQTLQLKINTASAFASSGTVNIVVRETDPRDPAGFRDTSLAITVAPAASGTVWNAATSGPNVTISGGGLVATFASSSGDMARANNGHSGTGDWWFDLTFVTSGNAQIGLSNATEPDTGGMFLGDSANSVGWNLADGSFLGASGGSGTSPAYVTGDIIRTRLKNGKVYFAKNTGSGFVYVTGMDPVAQTGGLDVSTKGVLFPAVATANTWQFTADFTNWP